MKPAPFEYHRPDTVAEAVTVLAAHGDEAKPLAGGQSLVPMLALRLARFEHLVDVNFVDELVGIDRADGWLRIGAMTRQAAVERDAVVAADAPLLARATPLIGHFQIRNRGTIGGSLAHADPASEYPAVAVALGAEVEIAAAGGSRTVAAADFFLGTWTTALADGELLTAVRLPVWSGRCGFAIEEMARRLGDFALAGAAVAIRLNDADDGVAAAGIGLFGVGPTPVKARRAEAALVAGERHPAEIGRLAMADADPTDDVHATAGYRTRVGAHLVARAVERALAEARGGQR
ncbi:MAG: molybdopterin dehydrogenase FAD-binding protein [Acidimicrobiales bacterium]|nr:molybdopterin dehydrogenase FAD-binding protein [Acidimicrobiales bacterium]